MNDLPWLNQLFPASITHTCHFHKNDENIIMDSTKIVSQCLQISDYQIRKQTMFVQKINIQRK